MPVSIAPYGTWNSPITTEWVTLGQKRFGMIVMEGNDVYWEEQRPNEGGRTVIVKNGKEAISDQFSSRTRVHEYGGASFTVKDGIIYFVNDKDHRIYIKDQPLTEPGTRFADLKIAGNYLVAVGEKGSDNFLSAIDLATGKYELIATGHDFYASPALSPDGKKLAFLSWDHPNMPWDGTDLWTGDFQDGKLTNVQHVAGGKSESIFQPQWSKEGKLYYVSDRSGWWNLYRNTLENREFDQKVPQNSSSERAAIAERQDASEEKNSEAKPTPSKTDSPTCFGIYQDKMPLCPMEAEFGLPQWVFGMSTYAFVDDKIVAAYQQNGQWQLAMLPPFKTLPLSGTYFSQIRTSGNMAALIKGSPTEPTAVVRLNLTTLKEEILAQNLKPHIDPGYFSTPKFLTYPSANGRKAYAYFYSPANKDYQPPEGELPPLIVMSHGGPTSATVSNFNLRMQYWTSRGFAVLDVDYGGSTGYGRAYRDQLKNNWGIVDVEDCEAGAQYVISQKWVDPKRAAITGGSAGGFTTLAALTFGKVFTVGASYYGVSDLSGLVEDTHKFESRYLEGLVAPYPEGLETYQSRSPLQCVDQLHCPVIFFQGAEDKVVPQNQAEKMFNALQKRGILTDLIIYEGEQHGFRKAENIRDSLEKERLFYLKVWNIQ
jgi:dipeptidyl aminopeptidase/acylaminoacyl peptidase